MSSHKNARARYHLRISGIVQGVFFRKHAQDVAMQRGLVGWVKNCRDGDVEVIIEGARDHCDSFIEWARSGSPHAEVVHVDTRDLPVHDGEFSDFAIVI